MKKRRKCQRTIGSEAGNYSYTQELLKNIRTSDLHIEGVFKSVRISVRNFTQGKQTPWESSSLTGDFFFLNPDAGWLKGTWVGTGYQHDAFSKTWTIILIASDDTYFIEYPSLYCGGEWTLISLNPNIAKFREKITYGSCTDNGEIVIQKLSETQVAFRYYRAPAFNRITSSATLDRLDH